MIRHLIHSVEATISPGDPHVSERHNLIDTSKSIISIIEIVSFLKWNATRRTECLPLSTRPSRAVSRDASSDASVLQEARARPRRRPPSGPTSTPRPCSGRRASSTPPCARARRPPASRCPRTCSRTYVHARARVFKLRIMFLNNKNTYLI